MEILANQKILDYLAAVTFPKEGLSVIDEAGIELSVSQNRNKAGRVYSYDFIAINNPNDQYSLTVAHPVDDVVTESDDDPSAENELYPFLSLTETLELSHGRCLKSSSRISKDMHVYYFNILSRLADQIAAGTTAAIPGLNPEIANITRSTMNGTRL